MGADAPLARALRLARQAGRLAVDLLLPPRCLACGALVAEPGSLCVACWGTMTFITAPQCAVCGIPFEIEAGDSSLCGACAAVPPHFGRARAVLRYDDASRRLLLAFKHADRTDAAPAFGRWLARIGAPLLADADLIVPVPLHPWRLFTRRYNQAALLALALARLSGVPADVDVLRRKRATPPQGHLDRSARARNVHNAFVVARPDGMRGRHVLLVDDVLTTGATVGECARMLLAAGASTVDVLAVAQVVRNQG